KVVAALNSGRVGSDRWLLDAATAAAAANAREFLAEVLGASGSKARHREEFYRVTARVAEHYARGGPADSVGDVLLALANPEPRVTETVIAGLVRGWPRDKPAQLTEIQERALVALLPKLTPASRGPLVHLAGRWGSKALDKYSGTIAASLLA